MQGLVQDMVQDLAGQGDMLVLPPAETVMSTSPANAEKLHVPFFSLRWEHPRRQREEAVTTTIEDVPIIVRREIEARIAGPLINAYAKELGKARAVEIASEVIQTLAEESGASLAKSCGGDTLGHLAEGTKRWSAGGALERDVLAQSERSYDFDIVRCGYAEMYKSLGLADLGFVLSCGRDGKMYGGFNREIRFERTQTIMQGASHCDFRLSLDSEDDEPS